MASNRGLGKGLEALFADNSTETGKDLLQIAIAEIEPDRQQPRRNFDEEALAELADSIREHGVLQPILLRPQPSGGYKIVAGERRFRAAHAAGLNSVPAIVRDLSAQQALEAALVENLQREDLNPVEEAMGYQNLIEGSGITQEDAAKRVGKSRSVVTNSLRLLTLPEHTLGLLRDGALTTGHAKALLSMPFDDIDAVADRIAAENLSVREVEGLGKKRQTKRGESKPLTVDPVASEVELALREALGVEVRVSLKDGCGTLSVDFYSKDQLFEFANKLGCQSNIGAY
ncbi:MAG: ParB/RepB/Spo0J family partition protein [Oscillospiraceae bacterium]|nr:ParB/RepB/Spo0J family partition protein [Oscillospiraceae bacterium]